VGPTSAWPACILPCQLFRKNPSWTRADHDECLDRPGAPQLQTSASRSRTSQRCRGRSPGPASSPLRSAPTSSAASMISRYVSRALASRPGPGRLRASVGVEPVITSLAGFELSPSRDGRHRAGDHLYGRVPCGGPQRADGPSEIRGASATRSPAPDERPAVPRCCHD